MIPSAMCMILSACRASDSLCVTTMNVCPRVPAQIPDQLWSNFGICTVQVPGRLVCQYDFRGIHECPGDGHPLLLPRRRAWAVSGRSVLEPDLSEQVEQRALTSGSFLPCDQGRHGDVFQGGEFGEEMVELEDKSDAPVPEPGELFVAHGKDIRPLVHDASRTSACPACR